MGNLSKAEIRVGGNPTKPDGAWKYMAPFSPKDVIAENILGLPGLSGILVITIRLSRKGIFEVEEGSIMEAFLTDGLRSVLANIPAEEMSEYTVRWPGHIQKFIDQRDSGKLDEGDLLEEWRYHPEKSEFTWLEVVAHAENRSNEMGDYRSWTRRGFLNGQNYRIGNSWMYNFMVRES